jgi:zinc transporter ZupT
VSILTYKALAALIIFIATILAVIYPIKARTRPQHHRFMDLGDAFASGVFLGAALFHMLPDAIGDFRNTLGDSHYPWAEFFCAAGFILLLFLERLSLNSNRLHSKLTIPYLAAVTLIIHSLIEGAALGVSTELATASVIFLAIFIHKGSESFALSITLCRGNVIPSKQLYWILGVFSLMTPIGIALGSTIAANMQFEQGELIGAGFNAFAAGTFLYMSTLHHIHHHQRLHEAEGMLEFVCLLSGLILMGLIVIWV